MKNSIILAVLFWIAFIALLAVSSQPASMFPPEWQRHAYGILGTLSAFLVTRGFLKFEKRSFKEIGLVWEIGTISRFFKGILAGIAIFILILLALMNFTELQFQRNPKGIDVSTAVGYLAFFPLALMEEVSFRSYPFLKLNKSLGLWLTQLIAAVAFALYHILNGWSVYIAFAGPFVWAFVFGLAAVWSGGIAMATGLHIAVNILQPLTGITGADHSIWIMRYEEGAPANLIARTETVGLIIQLAILAGALILTAFYIRRARKKEVQIL